MKVIPASYEILDRRGLTIPQKIEMAARLAYKSEGAITEHSAIPFCNKLINAKHYPVIEFANLHIKIDTSNLDYSSIDYLINDFMQEVFPIKYITITFVEGETSGSFILVSGTLRGLLEGVCYNTNADGMIAMCIRGIVKEHTTNLQLGIVVRMEYLNTSIISAAEIIDSIPMAEDHLMCAVKFVVNRAVSHELVRHRPLSAIQESQRYCNYSQGKFNNEVTFIRPTAFFKECVNMNDIDEEINVWTAAMAMAEMSYLKLLKTSSPQAARTVLPNSCKTEIILYATIAEWNHIFNLRTSTAAEPSMREVMIPLSKEFFSDENKLKWE